MTPSTIVRISECLNVLANTTPSLPLSSVVATPVEIFCGEIILPITPPDELVAAIRIGLRLSWLAATTWRLPNSALPDVSLPERNTATQPRNADTSGKNAPTDAAPRPSD